jgi:hypothetical protein
MTNTYGFLFENKHYSNAINNSLESMAMIALKMFIKTDGFKYHDKGRVAFIKSCMSHLDEISGDENKEPATMDQAIEWIADHLVYSVYTFTKNKQTVNGDDNVTIADLMVAKLKESVRIIEEA